MGDGLIFSVSPMVASLKYIYEAEKHMTDLVIEQQRKVAGVRFHKVGKLYNFDYSARRYGGSTQE